MTLFNTIFGPLTELKSVIFRKIFPPGPGSRLEIYCNHESFLELYPCLYSVQLPNYLGAVPGTGRKTLRYMKNKLDETPFYGLYGILSLNLTLSFWKIAIENSFHGSIRVLYDSLNHLIQLFLKLRYFVPLFRIFSRLISFKNIKNF